MTKNHKKSILLLLILIIIGQIVFFAVSDKYTTTSFESKIYTTTGVVFDTGGNLHTTNEAAHYFGHTIIGWTKFPNFRSDLVKYAGLPSDATINMHLQQRQNFVFTVFTKNAIKLDQLKKVKDFVQMKVNEYNSKTKTKFVLSNLDYEQVEITRSYSFGALFTLVISIAIGLGVLFIKKEFFQMRIKF